MAKTAIVTGGSKGIGKAIALQLAKDGFFIVVNYASNEEKAIETVEEIKKIGSKAIHVQGSVASEKEMDLLFKKTKEEFQGIDVVVNSAGVMSNHPISDMNLKEFDRIIETNLRGAFIVLSMAAKHINKGGRIIALSTSIIARSQPTYGAYIASKLGVEGLVHVLANELRGKEITVNAVAPGPVGTDLFFAGKSPELIEQMKKLPPLERLGIPEDISTVVSFLASPGGYWINNQVLRVNGGFA